MDTQAPADQIQANPAHASASAQPESNDSLDYTEPDEDDPMDYYQEYCRLLLINTVLSTQIREILGERTVLGAKIQHLEQLITSHQNSVLAQHTHHHHSRYDRRNRQARQNEVDDGDATNEEREPKKRTRRAASEIQRHFKCPLEGCDKSYGSEGSLNQHIKLKHPELYETIIHGTMRLEEPVQSKINEEDSEGSKAPAESQNKNSQSEGEQALRKVDSQKADRPQAEVSKVVDEEAEEKKEVEAGAREAGEEAKNNSEQ